MQDIGGLHRQGLAEGEIKNEYFILREHTNKP